MALLGTTVVGFLPSSSYLHVRTLQQLLVCALLVQLLLVVVALYAWLLVLFVGCCLVYPRCRVCVLSILVAFTLSLLLSVLVGDGMY